MSASMNIAGYDDFLHCKYVSMQWTCNLHDRSRAACYHTRDDRLFFNGRQEICKEMKRKEKKDKIQNNHLCKGQINGGIVLREATTRSKILQNWSKLYAQDKYIWTQNWLDDFYPKDPAGGGYCKLNNRVPTHHSANHELNISTRDERDGWIRK